jgi:hypothetical protein
LQIEDPDLPARRRDLYVAAVLRAIVQGEEEIGAVQTRTDEELYLLQYLVTTAREGHENLLPLRERRLKVNRVPPRDSQKKKPI